MFPALANGPRPILPVLIGLVLLPALSCGDGAQPDGYTAVDGRLRDALGRELLLHGVNARIEGLYDVSFDDGREALLTVPTFTEEDCRFIGEEMGLDHLRLLVNWSAIEPSRRDYDEAYVARVLEIAAMCERHGVLSVVDLHQDGFSKEIGADGAPLWAIQPPPTMLRQGPNDPENSRSAQVLAAFRALYADTYGTRTDYANMAAWLARRIDGKPGILGLELQNEPMSLLDHASLIAFHHAVAERVRAAAPNTTVFFEPDAIRNVTDEDPADPPFLMSDSVYSPHVYTDVFENGWADEDASAVQQSVARARSEATTHGAALYVGEFGHDDTEHGALYVRTAMDAFDAALASWAYWVYEEWAPNTWGLYDSGGTPVARTNVRGARVDLLSRAYPVAIAGHIESFTYEGATRMLTVHVSSTFAEEHVLSAPQRTYPDGVIATCDGTPTPVSLVAARAILTCSGSTITLAPAR